DGTQIYVKNSAEQVIDILKNSRQPMLTVCLSDTVRQVQAEMARKKAPVSARGGRRRARRMGT
ncbi:MAG TPA: hypothetical protein VGL17_05855, partial [Gemmatimonadaceae bacterium]